MKLESLLILTNGDAGPKKAKADIIQHWQGVDSPYIIIDSDDPSSPSLEDALRGPIKVAVGAGGDGTFLRLLNAILLLPPKQRPILAAADTGTGGSLNSEFSKKRGIISPRHYLKEFRLLAYAQRKMPEEIAKSIRPLHYMKFTLTYENKRTEEIFFSFGGIGWDAAVASRYERIKAITRGRIRSFPGYLLACADHAKSLLLQKSSVSISLPNGGKVLEKNLNEFVPRELRENELKSQRINAACLGTSTNYGFGLNVFHLAHKAVRYSFETENGQSRGIHLRVIGGNPLITTAKLVYNVLPTFDASYSPTEVTEIVAPKVNIKNPALDPFQVGGDVKRGVKEIDIEYVGFEEMLNFMVLSERTGYQL